MIDLCHRTVQDSQRRRGIERSDVGVQDVFAAVEAVKGSGRFSPRSQRAESEISVLLFQIKINRKYLHVSLSHFLSKKPKT